MKRLQVIEPVGYLDFLRLMSASACVLTDSGGIQEETTILGIPCLTLRENTERPVTLTEGTNKLVGTDPEKIMAGYNEIKDQPIKPRRPEFWDGKAAQRIAREIESWHRDRATGANATLASVAR
jgi:UDP-N-acetylglucosamine 2-epimerase (non-hydrolysing)